MNIIDELVTLLGLKISPDADQQAAKFQARLKSINNYAEVVAGTLMSAATAALYFVQKANQASAEIDKLGDLTGQNKQQIQMWARAVEQMGGSAASAKSDIVNLTRALNPVMPGEYNQGLFMLFGGNYLHKFKDVNSLLDALSVKFKNMPAGKALNWASQIGISPDMLLLLRNSTKELKEVQSKISGFVPILSDKELKNARMFEMYWTGIKQIWSGAAEKASALLAPSIARIAETMARWLQKNQGLIESKLPVFIEGVAKGIGTLINVIEILLSWFTKLIKLFSSGTEQMGQTKAVAYAIVGAFGVLAASLVLIHAKFLLVTSVIALFITQLKDMYDEITDNAPHADATLADTIARRRPAFAKFMNGITGGWLFDKQVGAGKEHHEYDAIIAKASQKYNVPESLIRSMIRNESGWDPNNISGKGAMGLMQLMPNTANEMNVKDPYNPEQNIMGGVGYFRKKLDEFHGNVALAVAAYNAGSGNIKKGNFPMETQDYVNKVLRPFASNTGADQSYNNTNVTITNNIQGDNAPAVASETSRKMSNTLQTLFPGGRAPVVN